MREPFKSGVLDHEAVGKRYHDIFGDSPFAPVGTQNGVSVEPKPEPVVKPPRYYGY